MPTSPRLKGLIRRHHAAGKSMELTCRRLAITEAEYKESIITSTEMEAGRSGDKHFTLFEYAMRCMEWAKAQPNPEKYVRSCRHVWCDVVEEWRPT